MTEANESVSPTMKMLSKKVKQAEEVGEDKVLAMEKPVEKKVVKKKAASKAKVVATEDVIVKVASEFENMDFGQVQKRLGELLESEGLNDFAIGGALSVISLNKWWEIECATFAVYVEQEFGIAYRKARYLIDIYNNLVESGVSWESVKGIGWTKLKDIAKYLTVDNVDEWVERCNTMNHVTLQEYLRALKNGELGSASTGEELETTATLTTFSIKLHDDQKELLQGALEFARKQYGTEYDAVALEYIVTGFMESKTGKPNAQSLIKALQEVNLDAAIEAFENAYEGVKFSLELPT